MSPGLELPVPSWLEPYVGTEERQFWLPLGGVLLLTLALLLICWLLFGRGARRARALRRARGLLDAGDWESALHVVTLLQRGGRMPARWQIAVRQLEGDCLQHAAEVALQQKRYEESATQGCRAAELRDQDSAPFRARVVETMLGEARRLVAARQAGDALQLLSRTLAVQSPCPEASFWQALCHVQEGRPEQAVPALLEAHAAPGPRFVDPVLYLGAVLLRQGQAHEAVRYLSEANRSDGGCPLVTWQLGVAMVAAGGDSRIASQALQRALGPRGLGLWVRPPGNAKVHGLNGEPTAQRVWLEALPEARSYVRRLALKHWWNCPVLGGDLGAMIRQGQLALAQAQYRLGHYQEAAELFDRVLQESPPSLVLIRGLGMALARSGQYDQAYKHLRAALEQEEPKHPLTAAHLALCAARGRPPDEADRPRNIAWAIRLLARHPAPDDAEWAALASLVFAEARAVGLPVARDDQVLLGDALVHARASDPAAAGAYDHLAATFPDAVRREHAWLFAAAVLEHGSSGQCDLDLLGRALHDSSALRAFFSDRNLDLDELEYLYLERWAKRHPGEFPPVLGLDYPPRGEAKLLERSRRFEEAGRPESALASAELLLCLAPRSSAAHDRLAQLAHQAGDLPRAAALLAAVQALEPGNPYPLVRLAIVEQQRGNSSAWRQAMQQALRVTRGRQRAAVAYQGARLELFAMDDPASLRAARVLLEECLRDDPDHAPARWQLAAVLLVCQDAVALAAHSAHMRRVDVADARYHYLAAVCHVAARDHRQALAAAERAASDACLAADCSYLKGWAYLHLHERGLAIAEWQRTAEANGCDSVDHARALLAQLCFEAERYDDAIAWWAQLSAARRAEWHLDEPLRRAVFLAGLSSYENGRFEEAAAKFREAGRLGLPERRLQSLLGLSLLRAGQRLLSMAD